MKLMKWMAALLLPMFVAGQAFADETPTALKFKMKNIDGKEIELSKYKGRVLLVVNLASK